MRSSIERKCDVVDNISLLVDAFEIRNFPISMGCTNSNSKTDILVDQVWAKSDKNGVYQLSNLIDLSLLYSEQHDAGTVGSIWMEHHKKFAHFMSKNTCKSPILEIGGAHGILSVEASKFGLTDWTIIEPAPAPVKNCNAKFVTCFFEDHEQAEKQNVIVHSHVLEHIYDPLKFLSRCNDSLDDNGKMLFSVPNIFEMVRRKYSNSINFEHTIFLSENIIKYFLEKSGFAIEKKEYFYEDHSIFYSCVKDDAISPSTLILEEGYDKIFSDYWKEFQADASRIDKIISETNGRTYLFGAHIFSQLLLKIGLREENIDGVLDNSKNKQNKRLYGSGLKVFSPNILKDDDAPMIILRAGKYNAEIRSQIMNINAQARII